MARKNKEQEISIEDFPHPIRTQNAVYFYLNRYKPKYLIGDKVKGKYNDLPWTGTVLNDTYLNDEEGPYVLVYLDKPMTIDGDERNILKLKHDEVKES
jgi:hypothetical protein